LRSFFYAIGASLEEFTADFRAIFEMKKRNIYYDITPRKIGYKHLLDYI
jgi:hypothetical protein